MSNDEIHENDVGTQFIVTVKDETDTVVNLSGATTLQLIFKKPAGDKLTKTASLYSNGTDGKIYYTSQTGDLDECGAWKIQGRIILGTQDFKTNIDTFRVHRNL